MPAGSADDPPSGILVLGLGNPLLGDDGAGLHLLERLAADALPGCDYLDGGTQGLALLGYFDRRKAIVILDAIGRGAAPGTVHVLSAADRASMRAPHAATAHEGNALELLATAELLGSLPSELWIVGIEPAHVATGIGLSAEVQQALPEAGDVARALLARLAAR